MEHHSRDVTDLPSCSPDLAQSDLHYFRAPQTSK